MRMCNAPVRSLMLATLAGVASACATMPAARIAAPAEIPAMEARYRSSPGDADLRLRLAVAYQAAGRAQDAVRVLEPFAATNASDAAAVVLAESYRDLNRFEDSRAIYTRLAGNATGRLRDDARLRLLALEREELRHQVQQAIAREAELDATPAADAVGVFPFLFAAANDELAPLSRAMAELLSVDLAQTDRLRVVERAQLQYLLDELRLAESGRVDPETAARAGRLVGAGRIVQGRIDGGADTVRLQALLVPVGAAPGDPLAQQGALRTLFDLEKLLALSLYEQMGIQLTAAERARVNRRPTENLQALLAFGFGLEAADAGRYEEALEQMERAAALDPGFELADDWALRMDLQRSWEQLGPGGLILSVLGDEDVPEWRRERLRFADIELIIPDPAGRDPLAEATGTEGLDRGAILQIIIRRPGGSQ
jgi:tetratricopeptide (TPR) repeat protein